MGPLGFRVIRKEAVRMNNIIQRAYASSPHLTVTPPACLFDEPASFVATGLQPGRGYTLSCRMLDSKGIPFASMVNYTASEDGTIDTAVQPALYGHYSGVQPMGLLTNARPAPDANLSPDMRHYRFKYGDVTQPIRCQLSLYEDWRAIYMITGMPPLPKGQRLEPISTVEHERSVIGPGVRRIPVEHESVRGVLYLPEGPGPHPGVIDMFGATGGCLQHRSAMFASRGIASLALAYFDYADLKKSFFKLDMRYFREAVDYLCAREEVYSDRGVGVIGTSKSADIALNMALNIPKVTAVVPINGCISNVESKFKLENGEVMPGIGVNFERCMRLTSEVIDVHDVLNDPLDYPETILPVENLKASVLVIIGELDRHWNSGYYADLMEQRVKGTPAESLLEVVRYPKGGHVIEIPYTPYWDRGWNRLSNQFVMYGGDEEGDLAVQIDHWERVKSFFKSKLAPKSTTT